MNTAPADSDQRLTQVLREGTLIALLAISAYLLLALASYNPGDPGWSHTGDGGRIANLAGRAGAWTADIGFSLFGYLAYLFPILLLFRAGVLFRNRHLWNGFDGLLLTLRVVGFVLVMLASTGLASLHWGGDSPLPHSTGGILGAAVMESAVAVFNVTGTALLLLAVFLFGLTIFTDLSWLKLMDQLGAITLRGVDWLRSRGVALQRIWQERRAARDAQAERRAAQARQAKTAAKRKPPKIETPPPPPKPSPRAQKEKQTSLFEAPVTGELPSLKLLDAADTDTAPGFSKESLEGMSKLLELKLADFGVTAEVVSVMPGPVVTRFEIQPAPGIKVSRISNLAKDLARSLAVISVRVVEVIPGKSVVGIEIPNEHRKIVRLGEVLSSDTYDQAKSPVTLALGHDIGGEPIVADLAKMPHLLVAGTTGSGKSVGVNAMLLSILYKSTPEQVRLMLVDPKMLELSVYEGIPHLLTPVITDMKDAANGLRWCVGEMERRYKLMAALGVRNLAGYNRKVNQAIKAGEPIPDPLWKPEQEITGESTEQPTLTPLPMIVVVIDEFADMMMIVGKKVEQLIARIAQKARAAGIHLVLATQRPSVDVITGLIKANIPSRIAFQVSSKVDSRTILDQGGAEQLLGHGDMLYLPPGTAIPNRVHGAFVDDAEVHRVVSDWKQRGEPAYIDGVLDDSAGEAIPGLTGGGDGEDDPEADALYDEAVAFVLDSRKASISAVQRKLRIGYNRAARLIEAMEHAGVVSEMGSNGQREVLAPSSK